MISKFLAKASIVPARRALVKCPQDYGMDYRDVEFDSRDGVRLKAWYIPGSSDNLILFTHPMPFNRYGFPTKGQGLMKISDVEVELLKVVKRLNEAGYGVLTMDMRNHGESGAANNGVCAIGYNEWQDVVGAMDYIKADSELGKMKLGMVVNCMGANSALIAMSKEQELFKDVKAVVAIQPVSYDVFIKHYLAAAMPLLKGMYNSINRQVKKLAGVPLEEMSPRSYLKDLRAPVMYVQVRNDAWTSPDDVQSFYDATNVEKQLLWIEGDLHRFDGYNYFGKKPEKMLAWLGKYM